MGLLSGQNDLWIRDPMILTRWLLTGAGIFFVGVGVAGVVLPLLPATPFFLLASACFVRSSPRLHRWLLEESAFRHHVRHWQEQRAMSRRAKVVATLLVWASIGTSAAFFVQGGWARVGLIAIAVGLTILFAVLRTAPEPMPGADAA